jgi:FixJ family two-component response regulator
LVTDVVMPQMHGPTLARELAGLQPTMRVLYVSGYSENDISAHGVIAPEIEVLQKPFSQQDLLRKIRDILDQEAAAARDGSAPLFGAS